MARAKLESQFPAKALLDSCPELVAMWGRAPLGPWDDVPTILRVRVPVGSAPCTREYLVDTLLLSPSDADYHLAVLAKDMAFLVPQKEIDAAVANVRVTMDGPTHRYIFGSHVPEIQLGRMAAAKEALAARHANEKEVARASVISWARGRLEAAWAAGEAFYPVSHDGISKLRSAWNVRRLPKSPALVKANVLPARRSPTMDYFLECAYAVDPAKGFPKQGAMPKIDYRSAASAAIIGAYLLEDERVHGKSAVTVAAVKTHSSWCQLLDGCVAYCRGGLEEAAEYVFSAIPALVAFKHTNVDGVASRADSISGLGRCDPESLVNFIDWAKSEFQKGVKL